MPYIGKSNDGFGIRERFTYLASNGATTISGADVNARSLAFTDPEYVDVYLNGVRLKMDTDYNLNTANTVSGLSALSANDEVEIIVHDVFTLADMVSASAGGSFGNSVTVKGDLSLTADAAALKFGVDGDVTVTHDADDGLVFKSTATADDNPFLLTIQTGETDIAANDILGQINFQAPDEGTGTDAVLVAAGIAAISEGDFSSSSNATKLSFQTGASEAAAEKMSLSSAGVLTTTSNIVAGGTLTSGGAITGSGLLTAGGNIVIPDAGNIGSASDTNAIAISSAGVVTLSTTTDSTSSTSGALVAHSAGFADDVYVGDLLSVGGDVSVGDDLTVEGGVIDLKTNSGTVAKLKFYCESGNAHAQTLQAQPHSAAASDTLTLPTGGNSTLVSRVSTDTLTNKTLTSPVLNTATVGTSLAPASANGATLGTAALEFSDLFLADGGEILFGADQDVILRHDHNSGLIIDRANTSDNSPTSLTLSTGETDIAADDVIGVINFQAPDEGTGTDAILVAAGIAAISEGDFSASSNATKLSFQTGASEAAAEKMSLSSAGNLTVSGDVSVGDDLALASDGAVMTFGADGEIVLTHVHNSGVRFSDSDKLLFGDGGDLEIYHDGSSSYIADVGTGNLTLLANEFRLNNSGNTENMITAAPDGAVTLFHNDSAKIATASTGVAITGGFTATDECKITTTGSEELNLELISTNADANKGPVISFHRNSSSPANSDVLAELNFNGENDASEKIDYVDIFTQAHNVADGSEEGGLTIRSMVGGTLRSRMNIFGSTTKFNDDGQDIDFIIESSSNANAFKLDAGNARVGIGQSPTRPFNVYGNTGGAGYISEFIHDGNNSNRYGLLIQVGADDASGSNFAIIFRDGDGNTQGDISFSGGTVSYNAFTASHQCIIPDSDNDPSSPANAYPYGTLLETTSIAYSQKDSSDTERGIIYNARKTQGANSKAVLGTYSSSMNGSESEDKNSDGEYPVRTNMHHVNVLGDGHILCNNAGGNIEVGDGICSSSTEGIGQKATANPSMIIGIAQEAVTFSNGTETKLVAVQYGLQQFIPWS